MIQTLLSYQTPAKDSQLQMAMFIKDSSGADKMEVTDPYAAAAASKGIMKM